MLKSARQNSEIKEIFTNIYFVTSTHKYHDGVEQQHSCNMIIIRNKGKLSLINTVRLDEAGLRELDALGEVENVIKIGSFHGANDAFYLDRYAAKLWALQGMEHANNKTTDFELTPKGRMPFPDCSLFIFEASRYPEGVLHIEREGGILITCDSVKNWVTEDEFFSETTANKYKGKGFFGPATVSTEWQNATQVNASNFRQLNLMTFNHLLSAHGVPLLNTAHKALEETIASKFS